MTVKYKHPFECAECSEHPKEEFTLFKPVDDWLIVYPKKNLFHLHYGVSTHSEAENIAEAKFLRKFFFDTLAKYPRKKFFVIVDCTRSDDSEFVPIASMKIYKEILSHPRLVGGAIYGGTSAMNFFLKALISVTRKNNIKIVRTKAEADKVYQDWMDA